jgi:hypothetical protein
VAIQSRHRTRVPFSAGAHFSWRRATTVIAKSFEGSCCPNSLRGGLIGEMVMPIAAKPRLASSYFPKRWAAKVRTTSLSSRGDPRELPETRWLPERIQPGSTFCRSGAP